MESKLNYTLVGLFVTALLAVGIGVVYWLSDRHKEQKIDYYRVYMTESVSGLSPDSSVNYLGVKVGTVAEINLDPEHPGRVVLMLAIRQGVPIKTDTVATLKFFGVTGLAFIELSGGTPDSPLLMDDSGAAPVIKSTPSTFARLEDSLGEIAIKSGRVLDRLELLLDEDNANNFAELLEQSAQLATDLRKQQHQFTTFMQQGSDVWSSMQQTFNKIDTAAASIENMAGSFSENGDVVEQRLTETLQQISSASEGVNHLASALQQEYTGTGQSLSTDIETSLQAFRQLLLQLETTVGQMQQSIQSIEDSPSDLLFKQRQAKPGPGEG